MYIIPHRSNVSPLFLSVLQLKFLQSILKKKYISCRIYSCHSLDAASIHGFPLRGSDTQPDRNFHSAGYILGQSEFPPADKDWRGASFLRWTQIRRRGRYFEAEFSSNGYLLDLGVCRRLTRVENSSGPPPSSPSPSTFTFIYAPEHCRDGIQRKQAVVSFRADQPNLRCTIWRTMEKLTGIIVEDIESIESINSKTDLYRINISFLSCWKLILARPNLSREMFPNLICFSISITEFLNFFLDFISIYKFYAFFLDHGVPRGINI